MMRAYADRPVATAIAVVVALFLAIFLAGPLMVVLGAGLRVGYLLEVFKNPVLRAGLENAFAVATVTTTLALLISVPLAWMATRWRFRGRALAEALLLAPLVLPPFVGALGIYQLLGEYGIVNTALAHLGLCARPGPDWMGNHRFAIVCAIEALGLYPVLYLMVAAAFRRLDPSLIEAARAAGAGRARAFLRVVLPLARPAIFGGGVLIFVWSFTELGTPLMLGYDRITPVQVWKGLNEIQSNHLPIRPGGGHARDAPPPSTSPGVGCSLAVTMPSSSAAAGQASSASSREGGRCSPGCRSSWSRAWPWPRISS